MDKQKQLNEMHQILLSAGYDWWKTTPNGKTKSEYEAECFYNAGYRKITGGAVMLSREEAETIYRTLKANEEFIFDLQEATMVCKKEIEEAQEVAVKEIEEYVQQARKETAEKFAERLKEEIADFDELRCIKVFEFIDEICKEISEGTGDVKNE